MLRVDAVRVDVPRDEVEVDVAGLPVLHHLPPVGDLLLDAHDLDDLETAHDLRGVEAPAAELVALSRDGGGPLDIVQGDVRILRHLHQGREGVQVPEGDEVVAVPSEVVDVLLPELQLPHHRHVDLRGLPGIRVGRGADVEGEVELGAPHGHVGVLVGVAHAVPTGEGQLLRELEAAVEQPRGIESHDPERLASTASAQAEALWLQVGGRGASGGLHGPQDDVVVEEGQHDRGLVADVFRCVQALEDEGRAVPCRAQLGQGRPHLRQVGIGKNADSPRRSADGAGEGEN